MDFLFTSDSDVFAACVMVLGIILGVALIVVGSISKPKLPTISNPEYRASPLAKGVGYSLGCSGIFFVIAGLFVWPLLIIAALLFMAASNILNPKITNFNDKNHINDVPSSGVTSSHYEDRGLTDYEERRWRESQEEYEKSREEYRERYGHDKPWWEGWLKF